MQLVRGGPLAGVKIWRSHPVDPDTGELLTERPVLWRAEVNGNPEPIEQVAPWFLDGTGDSMRGDMIDEAEYLFFVKSRQWATKYDPTDPAANPRKVVNMNAIPPIKW